jgi:hypothetical protein
MDRFIIGFSTNLHATAVMAAVIRSVEGTKYSHTYLKFWSETLQRYLIYHAAGNKVSFTNEKRFAEHSTIIEEYEIKINATDKAALLQFCVDIVDTPYGRMQLIGMGIARIAAKLGWHIKTPFKDGPKTQVCSELVGRALALLGVQIDARRLEIDGPKFINEIVRKLHAEQNQR